MSTRVAPWGMSVARPTCVLDVTCPPGPALDALRRALAGRRVLGMAAARVRTTPDPLVLDAVVGRWPVLGWVSDVQAWPLGTRGRLLAEAEPTPTGARVRVSYPESYADLRAGRGVAGLLTEAVRTLEAGGVRVDVGPWQPGG